MAGGGGGDKTEKATPKRRQEARKKGQVAKSADLNGAVVLLAALFALSATAPHLVEVLQTNMRAAFALISSPEIVGHRGLGPIVTEQGSAAALAALPVVAVCLITGVLINVLQVGGKPRVQALKPDPRRLNPVSGAKNIFGPNALFEGAKNVIKVSAVGAVTALAVLPKLDELAALVGLPPGEHKSTELPPEVRGAMRRRQMQAARARMMADVPQADVVVTNPTHFAVALRYDPAKSAPEVVAKGSDILAKRIKEIAREADVPVIADPPLARSLHASVEVGQLIPEEMFQAVAQLLAFVYRTARRRVAA